MNLALAFSDKQTPEKGRAGGELKWGRTNSLGPPKTASLSKCWGMLEYELNKKKKKKESSEAGSRKEHVIQSLLSGGHNGTMVAHWEWRNEELTF